jgi:hypothetical protein
MARPSIEPVTDEALDEIGAFLHQHLNSARSPEVWARDFRRSRRPETPNHGFCLRDEGRLVGVIGALYGDRQRDGKPEQLCNITSWCVLPEYRQHSTRLAISILAQGDRTYTDFSPTKVVAATLKFLKFVELDERRAVSPNLPRWFAGVRLHTRPDAIATHLNGDALRAFEHHRDLPWLRHLLLTHNGRACHVIYKPDRVKGWGAARVLHVSDPALYRRGAGRLALHWLSRGLMFNVVELRLVAEPLRPYLLQTGFTRKVVRPATGMSDNVDYLYSETLLFDLT